MIEYGKETNDKELNSVLRQVLGIITEEQNLDYDNIKHVGMHTHRFDDNPMEKIFSELWEKQNSYNKTPTIQYLMCHKNDYPDPITSRDALVAATVIQWLGSPVGQSFLLEVDEEKNKSEKTSQKKKGMLKYT